MTAHRNRQWRRFLGVVGLLWVLLGLSACAVSPEGAPPASRPFSSQAGPPTTPFLRIETGMHTAPIWRIDVDTKERYLVTASHDKTARVWDLATGKLLKILRPPIGSGSEGKVGPVAISPDGKTVAVGGRTGYEWDREYSIYLFDLDSGRMLRRIRGLPDGTYHLTYSHDGYYLAAALAGANGIRIYNTIDYSEAARDTAYGDNSQWIDFDHQGRLVTTSWDGYIRLYDANFRLLAKQQVPDCKQPYTARFSPAGDKVAVGFFDSGGVKVLSAQDLAFLYAIDTEYPITTVAWSQDGQTLYGSECEQYGCTILKWTQAGRGPYTRLPASQKTMAHIGF